MKVGSNVFLAYKFTKAQANYCTKRIAQGASYAKIHRELTSDNPQDRGGIEKYEGTLSALVKRINRIRPEEVDSYKVKKMSRRNQIGVIVDIINKQGNAKASDKLKAIDLLREFEKEDEEKASKSGSTEKGPLDHILNRPMTPAVAAEWLFVISREAGGYQYFCFDAIPRKEIAELIKVLQGVLCEHSADDAQTERYTRDHGCSIDPEPEPGASV